MVGTSLDISLQHYLAVFQWKQQGYGSLFPRVIALIQQSHIGRFLRTRMAWN